MKIDLGHGAYLEPDEAPRNSPHHKRIVAVDAIPNTTTGHVVALECGHIVHTYGALAHADGRVLCTRCRDDAEAE